MTLLGEFARVSTTLPRVLRGDESSVETSDANLSRAIPQLNGVYTLQCNSRHGLISHLFQWRSKAILLERDAYLLARSRYVVLNPLRAAMIPGISPWPLSCDRAMAHRYRPPAWPETGWTLGQIGSEYHTRQHRG